MKTLISICSLTLFTALALAATAKAADPETKSLLPNPSFEEVNGVGDARTPVGWSFARWNNTETIKGTVEEMPGATGKMALRIPACGSGAIGFSSGVQPVPENAASLTVHFRVKKGEDCTASPWVFIAWFGNNTFIGKSDIKVAIKNAGQWEEVDAEIPRASIPAGADHFNLNLALGGKEGATGNVWYDNAIVTASNGAAPAK